jgi:opacity protein-like surface antigen
MAVLEAKTSLTTPVGPVCGGILPGCSGTDHQIGAALGGGVEYGFAPNLSAKIELLHITAASLEVSHNTEIRAGLNYRLGPL